MFERLATRKWRDRLRGITALGLVATLLLVAFGHVWHSHEHAEHAGHLHAAAIENGDDHCCGHDHDAPVLDNGHFQVADGSTTNQSRLFIAHSHSDDCALCDILRDASRPVTLHVQAAIEAARCAGTVEAKPNQRGPERRIGRAVARGPPMC